MKKQTYDRMLIRWVKTHYWDSLEKDKDLILRHLRTFAGDDVVYDQCDYCGKTHSELTGCPMAPTGG